MLVRPTLSGMEGIPMIVILLAFQKKIKIFSFHNWLFVVSLTERWVYLISAAN